MIKRSQVAAARLAVAAAKYQNKEHELSDITKRLARLNIDDLSLQESAPLKPAEEPNVVQKKDDSHSSALKRLRHGLLWSHADKLNDNAPLLIKNRPNYKIECVPLSGGAKNILLYVDESTQASPGVEAIGEAVKAFEQDWSRASRLVILSLDGVAQHAYKRDEEGGELIEDLRLASLLSHAEGGAHPFEKPRSHRVPK